MITTLTYFHGHRTGTFYTAVYHVVQCQRLSKNLIWRRLFEFSYQRISKDPGELLIAGSLSKSQTLIHGSV